MADSSAHLPPLFPLSFPQHVPHALVKPKHALAEASGPFDGSTTNKTDFVDHGVVPRVSRIDPKAVSIPIDSKVFEGSSMYRDDFRRHPNAKREPASAAKGVNAALPQGGAFDDSTLYKTTFTPKGYSKRESYRPEAQYECDSCDDDPNCQDDAETMRALATKSRGVF